MFRKLTEDQQDVLDCVKSGEYHKLKPYKSPYGKNFVTVTGTSFSWLHGLNDGYGHGKTLKVMDEVQPQWYAKKVIAILQERET